MKCLNYAATQIRSIPETPPSGDNGASPQSLRRRAARGMKVAAISDSPAVLCHDHGDGFGISPILPAVRPPRVRLYSHSADL